MEANIDKVKEELLKNRTSYFTKPELTIFQNGTFPFSKTGTCFPNHALGKIS
jgi:hypothetical protein